MGSNVYQSSPRLYIAAEGPDFDEKIMSDWTDEDFNVSHLPYNGTSYKSQDVFQVNHICGLLDPGERSAIVGLNDPITIVVQETIAE